MIVLAIARCATCNDLVKGYVDDNSAKASDMEFRHILRVNAPHAAVPTKGSLRRVPHEIWHAISTSD